MATLKIYTYIGVKPFTVLDEMTTNSTRRINLKLQIIIKNVIICFIIMNKSTLFKYFTTALVIYNLPPLDKRYLKKYVF